LILDWAIAKLLLLKSIAYGGLFPNRIRIVTLDKIYQFATYRRKK
jgi:hypothetical protein